MMIEQEEQKLLCRAATAHAHPRDSSATDHLFASGGWQTLLTIVESSAAGKLSLPISSLLSLMLRKQMLPTGRRVNRHLLLRHLTRWVSIVLHMRCVISLHPSRRLVVRGFVLIVHLSMRVGAVIVRSVVYRWTVEHEGKIYSA